MASVEQYRKRWLRLHKQYERKALREFVKPFNKWAKAIDFDKMDVFNYKEVISEAIDKNDLLEAYYNVYTNIGLDHGNRVAKTLKKQKFFTLDDFSSAFMNFIVDWLANNRFNEIAERANAFNRTLSQIIANGMKEGMTLQEIIRELRKKVEY